MDDSPEPDPMPARAKRAWFFWWTVLLAAFFLVSGSVATWNLWRNKCAAREIHRSKMDPASPDPGVTTADETPASSASPVHVGVYVERIPRLSIKDASWDVVFDIWFRWDNENLNPGENFVIMAGTLNSRTLLATGEAGGSRYARYRVDATLTHPFSVSCFPFDEQLLVIAVENAESTRDRMIFLPDLASSSVSSRVSVPGYHLTGWKAIEKAHSYKTTRGDPRLPVGLKSTHSQFRLGISLDRDGRGLYFKMFQALFVAVIIAILSGFIKPVHVDPRFGLGVGALFAAVANSYIIGGYVPDTGEMVLADVINLLGILAILVSLIESTLSLHLYDTCGEEQLSRKLDLVSFGVMLGGFALINATLLVAANL